MAKQKKDNRSSVNILEGFLENPTNIAEQLDELTLNKIGNDALEGFQADQDSMQEWSDIVHKGAELIKPETMPKSEPWHNAANFKSSVITDAGLKFGDRSSSELLRGPEFVKIKIFGNDPDNLKQEAGDRVAEYMNWQLTQKIPEWIKDHNKLLYNLPFTGCIFKKVFFSAEEGKIVSDLITYPSFAVNHNIPNLERARRFTHILEFSKNEVIERQRAEIWLDVELSLGGSEEDVGEQAEKDKISTFLEQQTYIDLDDDGYEEPYTVTLHEGSGKVLRIVPRFTADSVQLSDDGEVIKIEPTSNIIKYGFLPNPDGGFLDVGYFHLLAGLNGAINVGTNALLNAGMLANMQTGLLAKGMREKLGPMRMKPGQFKQTNIAAQDLQSGILPFIFKEPSPTLFNLVQLMTAQAKESSASADLTSALGANAPATTTLALVQEQQQASGAIILRIYRAMSEEFKMMYILNSEFLDEKEYQTVVDDEEATPKDFNLANLDILPLANPEVSSKIQRIQLADAQLSQLPAVQAAGGNIQPVVKNYYESIGSQITDEIFPELTPEQEQAQAEAQTQQQQEQDQLEQETVRQMIERHEAEIAKMKSEVDKNEASAIKSLEEAETEQTKNLSDQYTGAQQIDNLALDNALKQRELQQPQELQNERNNPGNAGGVA